MLRQVHILYKKKRIYTATLAYGLDEEEYQTMVESISNFIEMPMPGKFLQKPLSKYQIFHRAFSNLYFIFVVDLIDTIDYLEKIFSNIISSFKETFPDVDGDINDDTKKEDFLKALYRQQGKLHSKIGIIGPLNSGKTTLYKKLTLQENERSIMNFAKSSTLDIYDLKFDLWDFQLDDNYSLLWSKFVSGADLLILLFNASKYSSKIIEHFLTLKRREGKFSKFLIIANKMDLIGESEFKKLQNELQIADLSTISLNDDKSLNKVVELISETLELKKKLPDDFKTLIEQAEKLENENNPVKALSKYKELVNISNKYQQYNYLEIFKKKVIEIESDLREKTEIRKKIQRKKKFAPPKQIKFTKQVKVKSLPKENKARNDQNDNKSNKTTQDAKLRLKPEDVKIQIKLFNNTKEKSPEQIEDEPNKQFIDDTVENLDEVDDLSKFLKRMIEDRGSSLSLELSAQFIDEIKQSLGREIKLNDLKIAADHFIGQEL